MSENLLFPAVNGTGVILHTGLGRAVLSDAALKAITETAGYCTIETDIATGKRGTRHETVSRSLCELTGGESALVVNNCAAAVMLILNSLARGKEVLVSRGQLVEIGGSFRMPDVMSQSGAKLVAVGAVNHTTIEDYRAAVNENTGMLMAVHRSNFEVTGSDMEVPLDQMVILGRQLNIPVVHDLGSGVLTDLSRFGLHGEPMVQNSVESGVSVVCFSGDKMMGGPQAGIIIGHERFLKPMRTNPLMRALRVDKITFAALAATIELLRHPESLPETHPVTRMISTTVAEIRSRADILCREMAAAFGELAIVTIEDSTTEIGGGSLPSHDLPTTVVVIKPVGISNHELARHFRKSRPPIFGRLNGDRFLLDVRTMSADDCATTAETGRSIYCALSETANH